MTNLTEMAEYVLRHATKIAKEEQVAPYWWMHTKRGSKIGMLTMFSTPSQKLVTIEYLKKYMADRDVIAYVFVDEAWLAEFDKQSDHDGRPASQQPHRKPVIMITGEALPDERLMWTAQINEDRTVQPADKSKAAMMFGDFTNLLIKETQQ